MVFEIKTPDTSNFVRYILETIWLVEMQTLSFYGNTLSNAAGKKLESLHKLQKTECEPAKQSFKSKLKIGPHKRARVGVPGYSS